MNTDFSFASSDHSDIDVGRLRDSAQHILERTTLCSIATVCANGTPYANTCFFSVSNGLSLIVLTPPSTVHAKNIARQSSVAITVFDSTQVSGAELQGLQLFGTARQANDDETPECLRVYARRFPSILTAAPDTATFFRVFQSRFFIVTIDTVKIFDEPTFGKETWIIASIMRDK